MHTDLRGVFPLSLTLRGKFPPTSTLGVEFPPMHESEYPSGQNDARLRNAAASLFTSHYTFHATESVAPRRQRWRLGRTRPGRLRAGGPADIVAGSASSLLSPPSLPNSQFVFTQSSVQFQSVRRPSKRCHSSDFSPVHPQVSLCSRQGNTKKRQQVPPSAPKSSHQRWSWEVRWSRGTTATSSWSGTARSARRPSPTDSSAPSSRR